MTYGELFAILDEAGLSPEAAAKKLDVSNMTLRRWRDRPADDNLDEKYARAFRSVLSREVKGPLAAKAASDAKSADVRETLIGLGFPADILNAEPEDRQALIAGLRKVGSDAKRRHDVERNGARLTDFQRMGEDWKQRIGSLFKVIKAADVPSADKLVAYGALFYLITPLDLLPDMVPVVGLLDDFVILGLALLFYQKHLPKLFGKKR